jgi:vacuolar-type H+-ATPase subunit E/Vma4
MALDDLLSAMRAEAEAEIARMENESRQQAAGILADAEREAGELVEEHLRRARAELATERVRRRALARLATDRERAAAREELFAELMDELRRRLAALRADEDYRSLLAELLRESRTALPGARRLCVDPRDETLARGLVTELAAGLEVRPELTTSAGLDLETDDGRRVRNTVEARLSAAEPELRLWFARAASALASEPRPDTRTPGGLT